MRLVYYQAAITATNGRISHNRLSAPTLHRFFGCTRRISVY